MTVSLRQKRQSEFFSLWQFIYDISVSYEQAANYEIFVVYARNEYRAFYNLLPGKDDHFNHD